MHFKRFIVPTARAKPKKNKKLMTLTSNSLTCAYISDWHFYLRRRYIIWCNASPRWTSHLMMINLMVIKRSLVVYIIVYMFVLYVVWIYCYIYHNSVCWRQSIWSISDKINVLLLGFIRLCSVIYGWLIGFWWLEKDRNNGFLLMWYKYNFWRKSINLLRHKNCSE